MLALHQSLFFLFRLIPNCLTLLNAVFGLASIYMISAGKLDIGVLFFGGSIVCDCLDGYAARKLNVVSDFGKALDSLADAVSFGVAPAFLVLSLNPSVPTTLAAVCVLSTALIRLAQFDKLATLPYWVGLPSPLAAALIWCVALVAPNLLCPVALTVSFLMVYPKIKIRKSH
jgi:CDP-diacylglycerol---serine O-phosphatidyltransferase